MASHVRALPTPGRTPTGQRPVEDLLAEGEANGADAVDATPIQARTGGAEDGECHSAIPTSCGDPESSADLALNLTATATGGSFASWPSWPSSPGDSDDGLHHHHHDHAPNHAEFAKGAAKTGDDSGTGSPRGGLDADGPGVWERVEVTSRGAVEGLGLVLRQAVRAFDVVFSEAPVLRFKVGEDVDALVDQALRSEEERAAFFALRDSNVETPTAKTPLGVCLTNAFSLGRNERAVLLVGSRVNHACRPNVGYRFRGGRVEFYALCNLCAGDELFLSYVDQTQSREARRAQLLQRYGFACSCELCSLSGAALEAAERRRELLADSDAAIFAAIERHDHGHALQLVGDRLITLREEPALATPLNLLRTEYDALRVSQEMEDVAAMRHWVDRALKHAAVAHGRGSPVYAELCNKSRDVQLLEALNMFDTQI